MRTIRLKPGGSFTAMAAILALTGAGAFAQEEKGAGEKEPAKAAAQKKAGEKKSTEIEIRITGKDEKEVRKPKPPKGSPPTRPVPDQTHSENPDLQPRTWLGIAMREVPGSLRDYLDLAEGFGVQVEFVAVKSPADEAGLQIHDILTKMDDQLLISPEHVALLVRSKKKGEKIELAFIRKGREQTAEVTLGEKELPPFSNAARGGFGFQFHKPDGQSPRFEFHGNLPIPPNQKEDFHRYLRQYQDNLKQWLEKNPGSFRDRPGQARPAPAPPKAERADDPPDKPAIQVKPIPPLPGKGDTGKPPAISVRPGYPLQLFGAAGLVKIDNPKGEVTITNNESGHKITIKNKDGETVYDGPYDEEKGPKGLPKEAQEQLKEMKLDDLKLLTPPKPKRDPGPEDKEKKKGEIL